MYDEKFPIATTSHNERKRKESQYLLFVFQVNFSRDINTFNEHVTLIIFYSNSSKTRKKILPKVVGTI